MWYHNHVKYVGTRKMAYYKGETMNRCRYYDNGKCTVLGDGITVDCQTIKSTMPDVCEGNFTNKKAKNRKVRR